METQRLEHFKILVEVGHMRQAAVLLGVSHGGLSKSIQQLEHDLGYELTRQSGRNIEITEKGMELYQQLPQFFMALENLKENPEKKQFQALRLASFEVFSTYFLGPLFEKHFKKAHKLQIHELIPGQIEQAIAESKVDLGLSYIPIPTKGVEFYKVTEIEMKIFTRKGAFPNMAPEKLPFAVPISPLSGAPTGVKGLDAWPDHLFERNIQFEVTLMETALELVRRGVAAVFMPSFIARLHNQTASDEFQLQARKLPSKMKEVKRDVYMIRRPSRVEDDVEKQLAKALRVECR